MKETQKKNVKLVKQEGPFHSKAKDGLPKTKLKELAARKFDSHLKYRQKHLKTMLIQGRADYIPKFWDDPSITPEKRGEIEWMAGVEVHKYKHVIAIYGRNERDHRQKFLGPLFQVVNNPNGIMEFKKELAIHGLTVSRYLMETTGVYHFHIVWELKKCFPDSQVIAMNAGTLKEYMPKVSKNDKADAVRMAQVAQLDDFIKRSYIPKPDEFALRELFRQRSKAVRELTRLKNASRKICSSAGFTYKFDFKKVWEMRLMHVFLESEDKFGEAVKCMKEDLFVQKSIGKYKNWLEFNMVEGFKANVLLLFGLIGQAKLNVELMESALLRRINEDEIVKRKVSLLEACNGLGVLSAAGIILESGDVSRFRSVSHYLSYCGISPSEGTSGYEDENAEEEKVVEKPKPNPLSNRELKRLYVGATGSILKAARKSCGSSDETCQNDMIRYSERYIDDKRAKLKLKFKIAAKLARRVFYCLRNDLVYEPDLEYNRSLEFNGVEDAFASVRTPKRQRQAWAYLQMKRLQMDAKSVLEKIQLYTDDPKRRSEIKNDFESFMRKYRFPMEFKESSEEGIA